MTICCWTMAMATSVWAQKSEELKVGQKIPDLIIKETLHGSQTVNLKNLYKDGLLIIDFWATWCTPCLREMKHLDSLKIQHPDKFNVLMVTEEDKEVIKKFFKKTINKDLRTDELTIVTNDKLLGKMFPHRVVPHNVWIDSNGIIKAITNAGEITSKNILEFSNSGVRSALKLKKDIMDFNPMEEFHLMDTSFSYRSIITPQIKTGTSGVLGGSTQRFFQFNASITHLFWSAYSMYGGNMGTMRPNLIEVHTVDSLRMFSPVKEKEHLLKGSKYKDKSEWSKENTFCYALTLPARVTDTVFRNYMFQDLQRQFNVKAKIESRMIPCINVTKTKNKNQYEIKEAIDLKAEIKWLPGFKLSIRNAKIDDVTGWWFRLNQASIMPNPFVVDIESSENKRFNAELDFSSEKGVEEGIRTDMFYRQMNRLGYQFTEEIKSFPILILYDQNQ